MKSNVYSKTDIDTIHHGAFSGLALDAYNYGYDLNVTDDMHMTLTAMDEEYAPKIQIETSIYNGAYIFDATVSFPTISNKDMDYADSFRYYMKKWCQLGEFITELNKFSYNPDEWVED